MRKIILYVVFLALWIASPAAAQIQIDLENVSREPLPLVNVPFNVKEGDSGFSEKFTQDLNEYLELSEQFRLIDPKALLKDPAQEGYLASEIDFKPYQLLSASVMIKGWAKLRGDRVLGELYAYDVASGQPLLHDPLAFNRGESPKTARDFVDKLLLKLTGERGIFDTRIAFISNETGQKELYVMNFDGTNRQQLTSYRNLVLSPAWSSDAEKVIFVGYPKNPRKETPQLFIAIPGVEGFRPYRKLPSNVIAPSWMPNGDLLATLSMDGDQEIYEIAANSDRQRRITFAPGTDVSPSLSPDGKMMVFSSDRAGNPQIYVQPVDGSGEAKRISFEGKHNTAPDWSPHGNNIAYSGMTPDGKINLFVTRPDGLNTVQMTAGVGNNESPSWSPDGRRLVFSSNRDGKVYHIYSMTVEGLKLRQLTSGKSQDTQPVWSPRRGGNNLGFGRSR